MRPPPAAASALLDALDTLDLAPHRTPPPEQVHLTLHFIGPVDPREIAAIGESVRRAASGLPAAHTRAISLVTLPARSPRLVAALLAPHPSLLELHSRLVHRLARRARSDTRETFLPHMTLCRFRPDARATELDQRLQGAGLAFELAHVELMRSVLLPEGARHDVVERVDLVGA